MFDRGFQLADDRRGLTWEDLVQGAPTIIAMAQLCSRALANEADKSIDVAALSDEARAILHTAAETGSICLRGDKNAFDSADRFLAVCVEREEGRRIEFKKCEEPEQIVKFMEGFRQLCSLGLVMHHMSNDFSLTAQGFQLARSIDPEPLQPFLDCGRETI